MSKTTDTRTVEMRFDNKHFETNVKQSMSTLDKLKQKLRLDGASRGLEEVEKKSKKLEFKDLDRSIDNIGKKFSALETIASGVFLKIGMNAADAGMKIVKSFTVDQIASGWDRLANKTTSIQVIMSSLKDDASKFTDELSKMEYVERWMDKISWFSDETSFDLPALTNGIGKLTSKAVGLEDAVTAVEGMSLWAASAGQNAQTAARMYDQLSQAVGRGYMSTQDWMSVETAQMDTAEFKELAIQIAEDMGVIKKGEVTIADFRNSLSKKWLTADVQIEAYKKYGEAVDYVIQKQEELADAGIDKTASEILDMLETSGDEMANTLAFKALRRGQEAKTFAEVIEATNTAVATGWMNIFETITGNYLQQRKLWTDLSNDLYHIFADPLNEITEILDIWSTGFKINNRDILADAYLRGDLDDLYNSYGVISDAAAEAAVEASKADESIYREIRTLEDGSRQLVTMMQDSTGEYKYYVKEIFDADKHILSGREVLLEGLRNLMSAFFTGWEEEIDGVKVQHLSILDAIRESFMEVFFPDLAAAEDGGKKSIAERLFELTKKFKEFTEKLKPLGDKIKNIFKGFFTVVNIVRKLVVAVIKPFKELFSGILGETPSGLLNVTDSISQWIQKFDQFLEQNKVFEKISGGVKAGLNGISKGLDWLSNKIAGMPLKELLATLKTKVKKFFKDFSFDTVKDFFKNITKPIESIDLTNATPLEKFIAFVRRAVRGFVAFLENIYTPLKTIVLSVIEWFSNLSTSLSKKESDNKESFDLLDWIKEAIGNIANFFTEISPKMEELGSKISGVLSWVSEKVGEFLKNHDILDIIGIILQIALSIGILWQIFRGIQMAKSIAYIGEGIGDFFYGIYKNLNANSFKKLALSLLIVAGAFALFSTIKFDNPSLWIALAVFSAFLIFSTVLFKSAQSISKDKEAVSRLKTTLKSMSDFIFDIALSLLIVAAAFAVMKLINLSPTEIATISGIFVAFMIISSLTAALSAAFIKNTNAESALAGMSKFVTSLAASLVILSAAFVVMKMAARGNTDLEEIFSIFSSFIIISSLAAALSAGFIKNANAQAALLGMSEFIKALASALLVLSIAFAVMSLINFKEGQLKKISIIFAVFIGFGSIAAWLSGFFIKNTNAYMALYGMAQFIKALASSLIVLSIAFAVMSLVKFKEGQLEQIGLVFLIFMVLSSAIAALSGQLIDNINSDLALVGMAKFLLAMAASLIILSVAFGIFAHTNFGKHETNAKLGEITGIFLGFMVFAAAMVAIVSKASEKLDSFQIKTIFAGLIIFVNALAVSLIILSAAFALMGSIKFTNGATITSIGIIFGLFIGVAGGIAIAAAAFLKNTDMTSTMWKILSVAIFIGAVATALVIVSSAFAIMASIDFDEGELKEISLIFAGFIAISTAAAYFASKFMDDWQKIAGVIAVAALMVVVAGALNLAALAITQLSNAVDLNTINSVKDILLILGVIAAALAFIGIVAGEAGPYGIAGLALIAVAVVAFGFACMIASKGVETLLRALSDHGASAATNLKTLSAAFKQAMADFKDSFGSIMLLSVALIALGVAILVAGVLAGVGLLVLSIPIVIIASAIMALMSVVDTFIGSFSNFVSVIASDGAAFVSNVSSVLNALLDSIIETGPKLGTAIYTVITAFVDGITLGLVNNVDKITTSITLIIAIISNTISECSSMIYSSIVKIFLETVIAIFEALALLIDPAITALVDFISELAASIEKNTDPMIEAGKKLGNALLHGIEKVVFGKKIVVRDGMIRLVDELPENTIKNYTDTITKIARRDSGSNNSATGSSNLAGTVKSLLGLDSTSGSTTGSSDFVGMVKSLLGLDSSSGFDLNTSWLSFFTSDGSKEGAGNFSGMISSAFSDFTGSFSGMSNPLSALGFGTQKEKSELDLAYERGELDALDNKYKTVSASAAEAAVEVGRTGNVLYREIETLSDGSRRLLTHTLQDNGTISVSTMAIYEEQTNSLQKIIDSFSDPSEGLSTITPIMDGTNLENYLSNLFGKEYTVKVTPQQASAAAYDVNSATTPVVNQETYTSNDTYNNTFNITSPDTTGIKNEVLRALTAAYNRKQALYGR